MKGTNKIAHEKSEEKNSSFPLDSIQGGDMKFLQSRIYFEIKYTASQKHESTLLHTYVCDLQNEITRLFALYWIIFGHTLMPSSGKIRTS